MTEYCDCEKGHNGLGVAGRVCDCSPSSTPLATTERYDIVDFLRQGGQRINGVFHGWDSEMAGYAEGFADMIEAGEHHSAPTPDAAAGASAAGAAGEVPRQSAAKYALICDKLANQVPIAGEPDALWWERQSALREAAVLLHRMAAPYDSKTPRLVSAGAMREAAAKACRHTREVIGAATGSSIAMALAEAEDRIRKLPLAVIMQVGEDKK